jgi:hypothetical protein
MATMSDSSETPAKDPVLVQRERMRRLASLGQRSGYLAFGVALALFAAGMIGRFTDAVATILLALLICGSIILAPSIVLHHAVKAADDLDAENSA